jgi:hypothetical protein
MARLRLTVCDRRNDLGESGFGSGREASDGRRPPRSRLSAHTEARLRRFGRVEKRKERRKRACCRDKARKEKRQRRQCLEMAFHLENDLGNGDFSFLLESSDEDEDE